VTLQIAKCILTNLRIKFPLIFNQGKGEILANKLHGRARLIQGFQISLDDGRSHCVVADLPTDSDEGLGPTPLELCVMSHAGCYAVICASTAKKMRLLLKGVDVKVEAIETDEAGTITEEKFDILLKVDAPDDRVQRLHELTLENCPVGKIFEKAGVKLNYNVRTAKE
jgi:uncharacterized OsmC-like protein